MKSDQVDSPNGLLALLETAGGVETISKEAVASLQEGVSIKLRELMIQYNNGRSSSMDVELAKDIMESLCYTLDAGLHQRQEQTLSLRFDYNVPELYRQGRRNLEMLYQRASSLWQRAMKTRPSFGTFAYHDTLEKGMAHFFAAYDMDYGAHKTISDLHYPDYPLALLDDHGKTGVILIEAYLRGLCLENDYCALFPIQRVHALLTQHNRVYRIHYKHLLINLFSLLFDNALFCILAGENGRKLLLAKEQAKAAELRLVKLEPQELARECDLAVDRMTAELGIESESLLQYIRRYAGNMLPTFENALRDGRLQRLILWETDATPNGPATILRQGKRLSDLALREITQKVMDCPNVDDKLDLILHSTQCMEDFVDILRANCLFGDEYARLFARLEKMELAILARAVFGQYGEHTHPDELWERELLKAAKGAL